MDSPSSSPKQVTNWFKLPPEVMSLIFTKVGVIDILKGVQSVCSTWRKLCKEPHLFREIDMYYKDDDDELYDKEQDKMMMKLAKEAVNRSCGQLVDFSVQNVATDELLKHIIDKNSPLRRLRFTSCFDISDNAVIDMAKKLPLLEELEIRYCYFEFPEKVVETFGRSCLLLKSFTLNYWDYNDSPGIVCDEEAVAVAQSMPELRHLNLSGTYLTDSGLRTILDGCPHLNFLELSQCSNLNFAGGLVKMCVDRNIKLRLLDEASHLKLINQMQRRFSGLWPEHFKPIPEADLEAGHNAELYATSSSNKLLLNELAQMQSILSVFQENIILILEEVQVVRMMQMVHLVQAVLQDMISQTERCEAWIMLYHSGCVAAARRDFTT